MNKRFPRVVAALLCAIALTGCDRGCDILVCNHSDHELILYYGPSGIGHSVVPCSVRILESVITPWPVGIRVTDTSGADIYTATLEPKMNPRGLGQVDVRIPAESSGGCPESLPDSHVVVVQNDTDQQVTAVVNKEELGTVEPHSTRTFGPFDGEMTFIPPTRIFDREGQVPVSYKRVEYLLTDEVPEYRVIVKRPDYLK
jgi:hypothetical protein